MTHGNYADFAARLRRIGMQACCIDCPASLACISGYKPFTVIRCSCGWLGLRGGQRVFEISKDCPARVLAALCSEYEFCPECRAKRALKADLT